MLKQMSFYRDHLDSFRISVGPDEVTRPRRNMRLLLIDDDSSFLRIMERAARLKGVSLTTCASATEAKRLVHVPFDAIVVDYMLGTENGLDTVALLEESSRDLPIILVSQTDRVPAPKRWPDSMREFVHKRLGPFAILEAALEAVEIADLQSHQRHM